MKATSLIFLKIIFIYQVLGQNTSFLCLDGSSIGVEKICDGRKDCTDGFDETKKLCFNTICPINKFRCYYGACIAKNLVCDGVSDCADGSDESRCGRSGSCEKDQHRCTSGECIPLTQICDGRAHCKDSSDEGEICERMDMCPSSMHRCKVGGCIYLNQTCDGFSDCIDGSDEFEDFCISRNCASTNCKKNVYCPPLISNRINFYCKTPNGPHKGIIPCNKPLPPGTVVTYECRAYYVPSTDKDKENKEMVCQFDGTWNRNVLKCSPDCGIVQPEMVPLIVNGWHPEKGKYPWHAVLFSLINGKWTAMCGGTLITEKIVLTAGHCVWRISKELIQVGFGKYYSDYYKTENYAQIKNVSKIIRQPLYQDLVGNYGSDIAILVLSGYVQFSPVIRPACMDWTLNDITDHLKHNSLGLIVGMGTTENDVASDSLRAIYLPVVEDVKCIKSQKRDFKKYITFTSFCAGWGNGSSVCNGDSGGGLVFPSKTNPNKFTLQGIVSVSSRRRGTSLCDPKYYTVFTKVGMYVQWIAKVLHELQDDNIFDS